MHLRERRVDGLEDHALLVGDFPQRGDVAAGLPAGEKSVESDLLEKADLVLKGNFELSAQGETKVRVIHDVSLPKMIC